MSPHLNLTQALPATTGWGGEHWVGWGALGGVGWGALGGWGACGWGALGGMHVGGWCVCKCTLFNLLE